MALPFQTWLVLVHRRAKISAFRRGIQRSTKGVFRVDKVASNDAATSDPIDKA